MSNQGNIDFKQADSFITPFPYFTATDVFNENWINDLFNWFEITNKWQLIETSFYEQYEFSFLQMELPEIAGRFLNQDIIDAVEGKLKEEFNVSSLKLVGVTAHKLVDGHHIGIHNDYIGGEETHRMVLHITPRWKEDNGGYFMVFKSNQAKDVEKIILPINNSVIGFEISEHSNHAVSTIYDFTRYSIVYTFAK